MKKLCTLFIVLAMLSCHKINSSDLTISDKVVLGQEKDKFYKQLDSLQIKSQVFYSKQLFFDAKEINSSRVNLYYSEVFNKGVYNDSEHSIFHYGLIYPSINSNSVVTGMYLLLVYTGGAMLYPSYSITDITKTIGLSQCIRVDLLDEIQEKLTIKYGQPTETINSKDSNVFVLEKDKINKNVSDTKHLGEIIKWKTKYLDITFFRGVKTTSTIFNADGLGYTETIYSDGKDELTKNQAATYKYPYIYYQINENTIRELKLNEVNL